MPNGQVHKNEPLKFRQVLEQPPLSNKHSSMSMHDFPSEAFNR